MQLQGETNNLDLYSDALYWCGIDLTDTTTYPIKDFTRNANFAMDTVTSLIIRSDASWKWDDANSDDLPMCTFDVVANQKDYSLSVAYLKIQQVRIKDRVGNWVTLSPTNRNSLTDSQLTDTGDPRQYAKIGNSLFLFPTPAYSYTSGIEVQYQRTGAYFTYTDTNVSPGFASQFHRLISLYPSKTYCSVNGLNARLAVINTEIQKLESELVEFYSSRANDEKVTLSLSQDDYGESSLMDGSYNINPDGFN